MNTIVLFYITFESDEAAKEMIKQLIEEKIIACGNVLPINSVYLWEGAVCNENEFVAILKTSKTNVDKTRDRIEELHKYDVPCIIHWEVKCNDSYYNWILKSTS